MSWIGSLRLCWGESVALHKTPGGAGGFCRGGDAIHASATSPACGPACRRRRRRMKPDCGVRSSTRSSSTSKLPLRGCFVEFDDDRVAVAFVAAGQAAHRRAAAGRAGRVDIAAANLGGRELERIDVRRADPPPSRLPGRACPRANEGGLRRGSLAAFDRSARRTARKSACKESLRAEPRRMDRPHDSQLPNVPSSKRAKASRASVTMYCSLASSVAFMS